MRTLKLAISAVPYEVPLRLAECLLRLPDPDEGRPVGRAGPELVACLHHVAPEVLQVGQPRVLQMPVVHGTLVLGFSGFVDIQGGTSRCPKPPVT